jgi:hypothetical protein
VKNRRWWSRVLDGDRVWGSIDIWPGRYGFTRYRLVVFGPGMAPAERRLLRLWRTWPIWGAALWLISEITLSTAITPLSAVVTATAVYLGAGAVALAMVNSLRVQVRTLEVLVGSGIADPDTVALFAELETLFSILTRADEERQQGLISAVDHETAWWGVYDRVAPERLQLLTTRSEGARGV